MKKEYSAVTVLKGGHLLICVEKIFAELDENKITQELIKESKNIPIEVIEQLLTLVFKEIAKSPVPGFIKYKDIFCGENSEKYSSLDFALDTKQIVPGKKGFLSCSYKEVACFLIKKSIETKLVELQAIIESDGLNEGFNKFILKNKDKKQDYTALAAIVAYGMNNKITRLGDWLEVLAAYIGMQTDVLELFDSVAEKASSLNFSDFIKDSEASKMIGDRIDEALSNLKNNFNKKETDYKIKIKDLNNKISKLEKESKIKNELKEISSNVLDLKNIMSNKELSDNEIKSITSAVNEVKYKTLENSFASQLSKLTDTVAELKIENKRLRDLNKDLEIANKELEKANKVSDSDSESAVSVIEESPKEQGEDKGMSKHSNFAIIEKRDDGYYAYNVAERIDVKIDIDMDDANYLINGQIVKLGLNNKIIYHIPQYTDKKIYGLELYQIRTNDNSKFYELLDSDNNFVCKIAKEKVNLNNCRIVGLQDGRIKFVFKSLRTKLTDLRECIEYKGHNVVVVLSKVADMFLIRDPFTGQESVMQDKGFDYMGEHIDISEQMMLFRKGTDVLYYTKELSLYTESNLYKNKKFVSITKQDELIYGKTISGEIFKLNEHTDLNVEDGDLVAIDEFKNILYYVDSHNNKDVIKTLKRKPLPANKVTDKKEARIVTTDKILIIGDLSYQSNYKLAFYKEGVEADTVNGFDNLQKMETLIRKNKYSKIFLITTHCSHKAMWTLKKNHDNVIYTEEDGANRLVSLYLNK